MLKYYIKVLIRHLLKLFWIFPIDNKKIYFQSFSGKSMNCNPWYIFKYMYEKYPEYKYVWLLNHKPNEKLKNITYVKKNTLTWVKQVITSKIIITNDGFPTFIPYLKKQLLIETWHGGGAYKKCGNANNNGNFKSYYPPNFQYYISSSRKFTEVMSLSNKLDKKVFLSIGMPRNDIFFNKKDIEKNNIKFRNKYSLPQDDLVVLYAPTYRGSAQASYFTNELDVLKAKDALFNKYCRNVVFLFRGHHTLSNSNISKKYDKDVSNYPDMQEILCATDVLITDYSSCMWDYSLLYRPCFLFTPDIDEYIKDRGFYTAPETWGFPISKTNEELVDKILNFNEHHFIEAIKKHQNTLESYEEGIATQKISDYILNYIN